MDGHTSSIVGALPNYKLAYKFWGICLTLCIQFSMEFHTHQSQGSFHAVLISHHAQYFTVLNLPGLQDFQIRKNVNISPTFNQLKSK